MGSRCGRSESRFPVTPGLELGDHWWPSERGQRTPLHISILDPARGSGSGSGTATGTGLIKGHGLAGLGFYPAKRGDSISFLT